MIPDCSVLDAPNPVVVVEKTVGRQLILVSRLESSCFWIAAAFIGCLFLGWTGRHSAGMETLQPLDTINPNTAPKESLVRLPGIGPSRAMAIVDYREAHANQGPVFRTPADLDAIAGLGPKTVDRMTAWISFDCGGQWLME